MSDLDRLAEVLDDADQAHAADVEALGDLDNDQIGYLTNVGLLDDPMTDGLEATRCP